MGPDLDIYNVGQAFQRLDGAGQRLRKSLDLELLRHARRALIPLPLIDRPQKLSTDVFPPFRRRAASALAGRRVAVVASGGAGACVALIGAARAFEEAGIQPELICGCSGGGMFGSLWAAGLSAQEMAEFVLSWQPERYLDPEWLRLPRFVFAALRGFTGAMKGEAVERLFNERFGDLSAGELPIPLVTIVLNTDLALSEYFGTHTTPEVSIGRLVRITIALPLFIESVEVRGHLYVDGGLIDLLPTQPVIEYGPFDHVFGINFMLPEGLKPDDNTGWQNTADGHRACEPWAAAGLARRVRPPRPPRARRHIDDHRRRRSAPVPRRLAIRPVHRPQPLAGADPHRLRAHNARASANATAGASLKRLREGRSRHRWLCNQRPIAHTAASHR